MNTRKPVIVDQATPRLGRLARQQPRYQERDTLEAPDHRRTHGKQRSRHGNCTTPPGAQLGLHHHEPEETYYVVSSQPAPIRERNPNL